MTSEPLPPDSDTPGTRQNGDAAAAAGMDLVPASAQLKLGYDEINKTRDYIATFGPAWDDVATAGNAEPNLIARFSAGARLQYPEPIAASDGATKNYVDTTYRSLRELLDALTARVDASLPSPPPAPKDEA